MSAGEDWMYKDSKVIVLLMAAGTGSRFSADIPKQFFEIDGEPMVVHSIRALLRCADVDAVAIVTGASELSQMWDVIEDADLSDDVDIIIAGGETRQDSVRNGLIEIGGSLNGDTEAIPIVIHEDDIILIHDAARPYVSTAVIEEAIASAYDFGAALPMIPVVDTIKVVMDGFVVDTPERSSLFAAQTPQTFRYKEIYDAHILAQKEDFTATDDAMLLEHYGQKVRVTKGDYANIKITNFSDIPSSPPSYHALGETDKRTVVGIGFDAHRFIKGRPLILGGIEIDYELGLLGHSDADVLTHALMDAILGALALGDIGKFFPDSDPAYKGISSMLLLKEVVQKMVDLEYTVENVDMTLVCEKPKMSPHIDIIRANLAKAINVDICKVGLKATTTEKLGFTGREEGIAAEAIVLLKSY